MDERRRVQDSRPLQTLRNDIGARASVSCRKILKLLAVMLKDLRPNHHAMVSLSSIVKRWSIDAAYTGRVVIKRDILHLSGISSRIFQPVDALC